MTNTEMQIEFMRLLKAISNQLVTSELPNSNTIFQMLTISQIRYLKEIYFKDGSHEVIIEKADELKDLTRRTLLDTSSATGALSGIAVQASLNSVTDFMFYIRSDSKLTRTAVPVISSEKWMPNEFIKYSEKDNFLTTPVHNPIIIKPGCYIENSGSANNLIVIHDAYTTIETTGGVSLEYIKEPVDITESVSSELPNFMHEDIVKFAVDIYINSYKLRLAATNNKQK